MNELRCTFQLGPGLGSRLGFREACGLVPYLRDLGVSHLYLSPSLQARAGSTHWVEKILEPGERLRADWPVEGTTGYEFLNDVTALFVDPAGEEPLTRLYEECTGERRPFSEVAAGGEARAGADDVRGRGGPARR